MKKSRFTEEQIVSILKESETGIRIKVLCYKHGISESTFYNWKNKFDGLEVSKVRRIKELEEENHRLKREYADMRLEHAAVKDLITKIDLAMAQKREAVAELRRNGLSATRACEVVNLGRSSAYREPVDWRDRDAEVITALREQLRELPKAGFWKCFENIRSKGYPFNHKRVYRVYCQMGLNQRSNRENGISHTYGDPLPV